MSLPHLQQHYATVWSRLAEERKRRDADARGLRVRGDAVCYRSLITRLDHWCNVREQRYRIRHKLVPMRDLISDPEFAQDLDEAASGFEVIARCREAIRLLHKQPTDFQLSLIWFVIELMLPRIFGKSWRTQRVRICRRLGMSASYIGLGGVLSGRKEGKSTAFGMSVAVVLLCVPNIKVALFSKTREQAKIILSMAMEFVTNHPWRSQFDIPPGTNPFRLVASPADHREASAKSGDADVSREKGGV